MSWKSALQIFIPLFSLLIGLQRWKYIQPYKYLFLFVGYGMLNQTVMLFLRRIGFGNNMFLGHIYVFIAFTLLCLFYEKAFKGYIKEYWFKGLILFHFVICVLQLLFFQTIKDYPSVQFSVMAIVMISFSLIYFHKVMVEAKMRSLKKEPMIWFNVAILFFFTGSLFHFILFNLFLGYSHPILISFGAYFTVLNAILYSLIGIGFWIAKK